MSQSLAIRSLAQAGRILNEMRFEGYEVGEDCRQVSRQAIAELLQERMASLVDWQLSEVERRGEADRRNGFYTRHLLTEVGDVALSIPRTRRYNPVWIVKRFARRTRQVDRLLMSCFLLGLSTRKVAKALLPILGERISPTTVSRVAKVLDAAVAAFHRRPLKDEYRVLLLDGVNLRRKTGAGAISRPILVVLGIRQDRKKEVIDFALAPGESEAAWTQFLTGLIKRGLSGEKLALIVVDGGTGLAAALETAYPEVAVQRCWAHKTRNILDKVKAQDREPVKQDLHRISHAPNQVQARRAAKEFQTHWQTNYPKAVACLRDDLDQLLNFLRFKSERWRKMTRTTNAIERCFVEVRRRTRPMGVFFDKASIERIIFAVFMHHNQQQGVAHPFPLT